LLVFGPRLQPKQTVNPQHQRGTESFLPDLRGRDNRLERGDCRNEVKQMPLLGMRTGARFAARGRLYERGTHR
jgi:hypothetical protein